MNKVVCGTANRGHIVRRVIRKIADNLCLSILMCVQTAVKWTIRAVKLRETAHSIFTL